MFLQKFTPLKTQKSDCKTPDWMNGLITLPLKKDQKLPRDVLPNQQTIIKKCYFIK